MYFAHLISSNNRKSKVHFEMCAHFNSQSESRFFFFWILPELLVYVSQDPLAEQGHLPLYRWIPNSLLVTQGDRVR